MSDCFLLVTFITIFPAFPLYWNLALKTGADSGYVVFLHRIRRHTMPGYASLTDSEFDHWAKGVTLKRQLGTNPWDDPWTQ